MPHCSMPTWMFSRAGGASCRVADAVNEKAVFEGGDHVLRHKVLLAFSRNYPHCKALGDRCSIACSVLCRLGGRGHDCE